MKRSLRKLLAIAFALTMIVSTATVFTACDDKNDPEDTTKDAEQTSEPADSESESETEAAPRELTLFENGVTEYTLIRPDGASNALISSAKILYNALSDLSSSGIINYNTDFVYSAAPITDKEILIGETTRDESVAVYKELEALSGHHFVIKVVNQKIVIAGTDAAMTGKAIQYFVSTYLTETDGKITMAANEIYTEEVKADQPYQIIDSLDGNVVASALKVGSLEKDGDFKVAQGACTDGKYIYIILENQNTGGNGYQKESHYGKIFKLDVETLKTVKVSEPILIDHGNDCTYNSDTNEIVITHNAPNYKCISYVDADTLELKKTDKSNVYNMYAIAYSSTYKKYVVGLSGTYDYAVFAAGETPKRYRGRNTGYTKQGMDCDDKYIYFIQYKENVITVHDWTGNYIRTIKILNVSDEPEAIFFIGDQLYMTSYRGGSGGGANIYKIDLGLEP